jgi:2-polyprenyl-6-methoxyphenol hydroxylase-like FAD-dependent oxidoreductase
MRTTDVAIVGGGLAGSTAAAMLGRAGHRAVVIDPHAVYPPDFRCEKLDGPQVRVLRKTGLADAVLKVATHDRAAWIARFGRVVEKRPSDQYGILYDTLVNTIRAEIPERTAFLHAKVTSIVNSSDRQSVILSTGEEISARLVVIANGLNSGLRHKLGMVRDDLSPSHSVSVGFTLTPVGRSTFDFPALTYYSERPRDRMAYLTLFPIGSTMRANLMTYRDMSDPWLRELRKSPQQALFACMPGLQTLTGDIAVTDFIKIRPADLYVTRGYRQPGVVLVGDAFSTSCPAAGTGVGKVFTDVERLCNVHIPRWLASDGMSEDKIASFYADPIKRACDAHSLAKAYRLRSLSIDPRLSWRARRWGKFVGRLGLGALRRLGERLSPEWPRGKRETANRTARA